MPTTELAGYEVIVLINGQNFNVSGVTVRDTVKKGNVNSNRDGGFQRNKPTIQGVEITLKQPSLDFFLNPFAVPFSLTPRTVVALQVIPTEASVVAYTIAEFLITDCTWDVDTNDLQPVSITGESQGPYIDLGQVV